MAALTWRQAPDVFMTAATDRPTWKMLLAYATIYLVWGSTFLAIRVGVREVPPFLLAAILISWFGLQRRKWQQGESND